jgi:hypothetical protein
VSCDYCTDPDGEACFPIYGLGPHTHVGETFIGSTQHLPQDQWPENYREDPDCPGMGVWWCPKCGDGKPEDATPPSDKD